MNKIGKINKTKNIILHKSVGMTQYIRIQVNYKVLDCSAFTPTIGNDKSTFPLLNKNDF